MPYFGMVTATFALFFATSGTCFTRLDSSPAYREEITEAITASENLKPWHANVSR